MSASWERSHRIYWQGYVPDQAVEIEGFATLPRVESDRRPVELSHPSGSVLRGAPLRRFSAKLEHRAKYVDRPSRPSDRMRSIQEEDLSDATHPIRVPADDAWS